ncbi:MAG: hypothetical protein LBI80_05440 [Endomicrobium sp.]|jgi:hypothetical protein|nr:hypothetical protein [Endomicrobium sp.]
MVTTAPIDFSVSRNVTGSSDIIGGQSQMGTDAARIGQMQQVGGFLQAGSTLLGGIQNYQSQKAASKSHDDNIKNYKLQIKEIATGVEKYTRDSYSTYLDRLDDLQYNTTRRGIKGNVGNALNNKEQSLTNRNKEEQNTRKEADLQKNLLSVEIEKEEAMKREEQRKAKVGLLSTVGAVVGGVVGTIIAPGVGTAIGSSIGGSVGQMGGQAFF